jgi:hypothetical protein
MTTKEINKVNATATFMADLAAAIEKAGKTLEASEIISLMESMKEIMESE